MSEMFEDIKGVEVVVDDILVWNSNMMPDYHKC